MLCAGGRHGRKAAQGPWVDLRWARLLRLAVGSRGLRIVGDQLLVCSSCGAGRRGEWYRRLGPPGHAGGAVLAPVDKDGDDCVAGDSSDAAGRKAAMDHAAQLESDQTSLDEEPTSL